MCVSLFTLLLCFIFYFVPPTPMLSGVTRAIAAQADAIYRKAEVKPQNGPSLLTFPSLCSKKQLLIYFSSVDLGPFTRGRLPFAPTEKMAGPCLLMQNRHSLFCSMSDPM